MIVHRPTHLHEEDQLPIASAVDPCDFVIFGGTGDLAVRKLLPALYLRDWDGQLTADTRIIAVARDDEFTARTRRAGRRRPTNGSAPGANCSPACVRPWGRRPRTRRPVLPHRRDHPDDHGGIPQNAERWLCRRQLAHPCRRRARP